MFSLDKRPRHEDSESDPGCSLLALSRHVLRCERALAQAVTAASAPVLLSLKAAPQADWIAAGLIAPSPMLSRLKTRLEAAKSYDRPSLLEKWHAGRGPVLPILPDTLQWSGPAMDPLISPAVLCTAPQVSSQPCAPQISHIESR